MFYPKFLQRWRILVALPICLLTAESHLFAKGGGSSVGLTLIQNPSARRSSLGDVCNGLSNEITTLECNPSLLSSLLNQQASLNYYRELEDSFGQLVVGAPLKKGGLGLAAQYYEAGDIVGRDASGKSFSVKAQRDISFALGGALKVANISFGLSAKYFSSELAQTVKGTAYAADVGASWPVLSRFRFGLALQNIVGTQLKYRTQGFDLPRIGHAGVSYVVIPSKIQTTLFADGAYFLNEEEFQPSLGLEAIVGPLALRGGYARIGSENKFSLGTGLGFNRFSLDYAFGIVGDLDSQHRMSFGIKFGGPSQTLIVQRKEPLSSPAMVKTAQDKPKKGSIEPEAITFKGDKNSTLKPRIYEVQEGDNFETIANKFYGDPRLWQQLYNANKHLLSDTTSLQVGQKIVVP